MPYLDPPDKATAPPRTPRKRNRSGFWMGDTYANDHAIVACIAEDSFGRGFWAYGCDLDWQDSPLGMHATRRKAERAAEEWVKERI